MIAYLICLLDTEAFPYTYVAYFKGSDYKSRNRERTETEWLVLGLGWG